MADYRIYSVDGRGLIDRGFDAQCDTDDDALDLGQRFTAYSPQIEVWVGTRRVGCLSAEKAVLWWPRKMSSAAVSTLAPR